MPQALPSLPITAAYSVTTPDILQHILRYTTGPTLAVCLRVCKSFYRIVGPLLYRHPEISDTQSTILEGALLGPIKAGLATDVQDLKAELLSYIKTMTIIIHRRDNCKEPFRVFPAVTIGDIDTVRVIVQTRPPIHDVCFDCDIANCGYRLGSAYHILLQSRPHKLVWANFRLDRYALDAKTLRPVLDGVETFTPILHPGSIRGGKFYGKLLVSCLSGPTRLRIIICPWSPRVSMAAGESVRIDNDNPPASESDISDFLYCFSLPICENDRHVEIYLIEQWTNSAHPLPTKERSAATFDAQLDHNGGLYADYGIRPCHIVFRNRRDYLMEGVEDEIDAEELARWRRLQDIEDRMGVLQL